MLKKIDDLSEKIDRVHNLNKMKYDLLIQRTDWMIGQMRKEWLKDLKKQCIFCPLKDKKELLIELHKVVLRTY